MERDNIIHFVFDKIFNQLILSNDEFYQIPFSKIREKTFDNIYVHKLIHQLTNKSEKSIKLYKYVKIIMNDILENTFDLNCLKLAMLNRDIEIVQQIIPFIKLDNELLMIPAEMGNEKIYFYLINLGLNPNISVYHKAILGNSAEIVKSIIPLISLSKVILESAFQNNNTEILLMIIDEIVKENIKMKNEIVSYPILNGNMIIVKKLEEFNLIDWLSETICFSAILSGSLTILYYVESKNPNIHNNFYLDKTNHKKSPLLFDEITYFLNGNKYYAHTMNYAIQSGSIEMVRYIYNLGYGITESNIITAIKSNLKEILIFLLHNYTGKLHDSILNYFGITSFINDKIELAKILIMNEKINIIPTHKFTLSDYQRDRLHVNMINESKTIFENDMMDPDYLMKYHIFFSYTKRFDLDLDLKLITRIRLALELNKDDILNKLITIEQNDNNRQIITDAIFLFGNLNHILKWAYIYNLAPSNLLIMELICYQQLGKLCYIYWRNLLPISKWKELHKLSQMIADPTIEDFFYKYNLTSKQKLKYIIQSGKKDLIMKWIRTKSKEEVNEKIKKNIKNLLLLNDSQLIKDIYPEFNFDNIEEILKI